jgi:hypothetical protein
VGASGTSGRRGARVEQRSVVLDAETVRVTRIGPNNDSNGKPFRLSESDQHREVGVKRDLLPASNAERGKA